MIIGAWVGVEPLSSIKGTMRIGHAGYGISALSSGRYCLEHRFCTNSFSGEKAYESNL